MFLSTMKWYLPFSTNSTLRLAEREEAMPRYAKAWNQKAIDSKPWPVPDCGLTRFCKDCVLDTFGFIYWSVVSTFRQK